MYILKYTEGWGHNLERRKIVRFIAEVTVVLFFTRFLGLIREAVLAATYGAGDISDAFVMAFTIPNTVLACIGTSIGTVYTPIYHEVKMMIKIDLQVM